MNKDSAEAEQTRKRLATNLSGAAGQYFIAAELSRRGIIARVTARNARGIDILASNVSATRAVSIQIKTNQYSEPKWILHKAAEVLAARNLFYVFVNLNGFDQPPTYHIVPSRIVATTVRKSHVLFLAGVKKDGSAKKDTTMRIFRDVENEYLGRWELRDLIPELRTRRFGILSQRSGVSMFAAD
jgi:hypothetical protein